MGGGGEKPGVASRYLPCQGDVYIELRSWLPNCMVLSRGAILSTVISQGWHSSYVYPPEKQTG